MDQMAAKNDLVIKHSVALSNPIYEHTNLFRISFSSGSPAKIRPLKIGIISDAQHLFVQVREYFEDQEGLVHDFAESLIEKEMTYQDRASPWAYDPLFVLKAGPLKFWSTVGLRPVGRYTIKHQQTMLTIEEDLTKVVS